MPDIDPEELKVFLQEVDEQLQLLDEDIILLEKEPNNADLIQEIFRAAHTLKGSSGMLGFQKMAGLTHVMEDTLDRIRSGKLAVNADLIDSLLLCLDALKAMTAGLESGEESDFDIRPLVASLREAAGDEPDAAAGDEPEPRGSIAAMVAEDGAATERLEAALAEELNVHVISITITKGTDWAAVRCLQSLNELSTLGEVIFSSPSQEEIEQEKADSHLDVILIGGDDPDALRDIVSSIDDIEHVTVESWAEANNERRSDGGTGAGTEKRAVDLGPEARGKEPAEQLEMAGQKIEALQSIRVDIDRLDALMNLVGELVIDRTRIAQLSKVLKVQYRDDEQIEALSQTCLHIEKIVDELNEGMMGVRMLPIGTLFSKFPRLVRDVARATGKAVDLVTSGEDTEIDRSVIEKIKDPLVHMLRNAVDHGIESAKEREAAGKPSPATVHLSAHHEQGNIILTLKDDGKGIDPQVMRTKAVEKGIITADVAGRLSDAEAIELIFEPGFSTAEKTTGVSGRGVGMDVVKSGVAAVNGLVKVSSEVGKGTTFTLQLPLTLATFRGLLVESGDGVYAFPLSYVQETVQLDPETVETIVGAEVLRLRGDVLPLLRLGDVCRNRWAEGDGLRDQFIVTVKAGDRPVAISVDALREQQEIVVKSLGSYIGQADNIAGASILGDGQVVLILDVASLVKEATQRNRQATELERSIS
ncbi:MAG: chemotaxis protein CheA [Chloroflexi bacterium]|nr:chemotaxis protein CheA [Chloroflexota bacterium]MCI0855576.1 chemotaxis protein CheA [Chloroflexota bacterium]MCI0889211.1 chemotaxis protein CheA [Chloroflexota bacterium]